MTFKLLAPPPLNKESIVPPVIDDVWAVAVPNAKAYFDTSQATPERGSVEKLFDAESPHTFRALGTMTLHGSMSLIPSHYRRLHESRHDFSDETVDLPLAVQGEVEVFSIQMDEPHPAVLLRWSPNRPTEWMRPNVLLHGSENSRDILVSKAAVEASVADDSIHEALVNSSEDYSCHIVDLGKQGSALDLTSDGTGRVEWLIGLHEGEPVAIFSAMDAENTTFTVRPAEEDRALLEAFRAYAANSVAGDGYADDRAIMEADLEASKGAITPEIRGLLHLLVPRYETPDHP